MYKTINRKSSTQSVPELFEIFINKKRISGLSERTINDYHYNINKFIQSEHLKSLDDISEEVFIHYINSLKEEGRADSRINVAIADIRVFLYDLMNDGKIKPFKINLIKRQEATFKLYTEEELAKLVAAPNSKDSYVTCRTHAIICFILATGARASTVLNVHREDIDFKNKQISFRHMKTKQALVVPLSDSLSTVLKKFMNEWCIESEYLFSDVTGEMMSYNALRLGVERFCAKRDVKAKGIHSLRHNFARGWIINNGNVFQLQRVLGHSTLDMSRKYVRLFNEDLKEDYECYSLLDSISHQKQWKVHRQ